MHVGKPTADEIDPKNNVASVVKAVQLLELFTDAAPQLSLSELIERGGHTRTTTHRLVSTLERVGWLERTGDRYRLSLRVFRLGSMAVNGLQLRHEASHIMSELAASSGEDVYLVVPDGARAVCLERIEGRTPVHVMALDIGKSLPLYVGGGPIAILAERETDLLPVVRDDGPLVTPTGQALTEEQLRGKLRETREFGYSRSIEDVTLGVGALGAPVFNARGVAVAALSVGALLPNLVPREIELADAVRKAAAEISARLGHVNEE